MSSLDTSRKIFVSLTPEETYDKVIDAINNQPSKWKFEIKETDKPNMIRLYGGRGSKLNKAVAGAFTLGIGAAITHYGSAKRIVNIYIKDIDGTTAVQILTEGSLDVSNSRDTKMVKFVNWIQSKLIEYETNPNKPSNSTQNPIDILKTKFVNGEITKEEYEEKMKILEGN